MTKRARNYFFYKKLQKILVNILTGQITKEIDNNIIIKLKEYARIYSGENFINGTST